MAIVRSHEEAHVSRALTSPAQCTVATGTFAVVVQAILGAGVLATLVFKRYRETLKRPWRIWAMDTSKQAFAMGLQHLVNVLLAVFFASGETEAGECIWYITNFTITVTCGLVILSLYMRLHEYLVDRYELVWLRSGEYGDPPDPRRWLAQLLLWGVVCCLEKFFTAAVVIYPLKGWIDPLIARAEEPVGRYPRTELVLVMVVCPALLNGLFAWIVDNLIKKEQDAFDVFDEDAAVKVGNSRT